MEGARCSKKGVILHVAALHRQAEYATIAGFAGNPIFPICA
jgi:hypothetical protein